MTTPYVSCLCPTYKRPRLLANAIACFQVQDYPAERRELVILDDAGQYPSSLFHDNWRIHSHAQRFPNLPSKFNYLTGLANPETSVFFVWEDDDIYLPSYISDHINAMFQGTKQQAEWSKPSIVWSLYPGYPIQEQAAGRFHASIVLTREAFEKSGGWPNTRALDFDQQFMKRLHQAVGNPVDPCNYEQPSYVFRWQSTNAYHGEAFGEDWYYKVGQLDISCEPQADIIPEMDEETKQIIEQLT